MTDLRNATPNNRRNRRKKPRYHQKRKPQKKVKQFYYDDSDPQSPIDDVEVAMARIGEVDLFAAYHLGLSPSGTYKLSSIQEVAKGFNTSSAIIETLLGRFEMDSDAIIQSKFDISLARLDMELAPPGISRHEIAKQLFEEFRDAQQAA